MFISNAFADTSIAPAGNDFTQFLPLIALVVVFYFLILRPQQKRAKEHKGMMAALQKGDEVLLSRPLGNCIFKDSYKKIVFFNE